MRERRLIATAREVRGMLDGTITQVRRVMRPQPEGGTDCPYDIGAGRDRKARPCPYGAPGDRLWVAESFCLQMNNGMYVYNASGNCDPSCCHYRADGHHVIKDDGNGGTEYTKSGKEASPWASAVVMPRNLSRITLDVVKVRAERLQDISEADAEREGCISVWEPDGLGTTAYDRFADLWCSIHGPDSWAANPWVWVVECKRIKQN